MPKAHGTGARQIEDILHFLVHNSILFTVEVIGLVHVVLLGIFLYAGVTSLVYYNIVSVIVYLFCVLLCRFGHVMPVYISLILEVSVYSVASVYYIGWDCGSHYFLFSIVPIVIYFGCFLFKDEKRWIIVAVLAFDFILYALLYNAQESMPPVFDVPDTVRKVLVIFSAFAMVFATIFYNAIYIYSSEFKVSNLEQKNEQLSVDAAEDALTSLLNRRGFLPIVGDLMKKGDMCHFCIAFCDIDNFKRINDNYGHDCGDEVLRHTCRLIKREMVGCSICRWGGEEIVILMRDYDMAVARMKMEYVRKSIESNPTSFFNKRIPVTITIGLAEYSDSYTSPEDIIKTADERMYYGKQHGKNILICEDAE